MTEKPQPYEWMFYMDSERTALETLVQIRRNIEDLPQTRASFRLKDVFDLTGGNVPREILLMLGCWEMPDRYSTSRALRYVNPNYPNAEMFTDLYVTCECGAYMARLADYDSWEGEHEHTDDCKREWRKKARRELRAMRKDWILQAADLWMTFEEAAKRMGLRSHRTAVGSAKNHGIDWAEKRKEGRARAIVTWRKLHDEYGYTYTEIGDAWDRPYSTVRAYCGGHGRNINV